MDEKLNYFILLIYRNMKQKKNTNKLKLPSTKNKKLRRHHKAIFLCFCRVLYHKFWNKNCEK